MLLRSSRTAANPQYPRSNDHSSLSSTAAPELSPESEIPNKDRNPRSERSRGSEFRALGFGSFELVSDFDIRTSSFAPGSVFICVHLWLTSEIPARNPGPQCDA